MLHRVYYSYLISKLYNKHTPVNLPAQCGHFRQASTRSKSRSLAVGLRPIL